MRKLQYNCKASAESTEILLSEAKQVIRKQSKEGSLAARIRYRLLGRMRRNIWPKTTFILKYIEIFGSLSGIYEMPDLS
jgi:hypothetical protein